MRPFRGIPRNVAPGWRGIGQVLEYPIGTVLYETSGWISAPRISRDGSRIAFAEHPISGDDQGFVAVLEPGASPQRLSQPLNFLHGIAWSADGRRILASYGTTADGSFVTAFDLEGGSQEHVLRSLVTVRLFDVSRHDQLLLSADVYSISIEGRLAHDDTQLALVGQLGAVIDGISEDGETVIGTRAVSTGPGEPKVYDLGDVQPQVHSAQDYLTFTGDGGTAAFLGQRPEEKVRGFPLDVEDSSPSPRAVTPEGVYYLRLSPDGRWLVAADASDLLGLYDLESGTRNEIPGARAGELPVAWAGSGEAIFVWDQTISARVERLELATGERTLAFEWSPQGTAEGLYGLLRTTTDARYFLMRFRGGRTSLVVAETPR